MARRLFVILLGCLPLVLFAKEVVSLQDGHPLLNELIYTIRDPKTAPPQFRKCLQKIGEYIGLEVAKSLPTKEVMITTVLNAEATHLILEENPVIIPVMRAGLPIYMGMQEAFPNATFGFIGAMRDEKTLQPYMDYHAFPPIENCTVILVETMIATGGSVINSLKLVKEFHPKKIIVVGVLVGKLGIERIQEFDPEVEIFAGCVDPIVNDIGYIVPGLGDAGDRSYGTKLPRIP